MGEAHVSARLWCLGQGHFSEMQAKLNIVTQDMSRARPFLLQQGKGDKEAKSGDGRCKGWH